MKLFKHKNIRKIGIAFSIFLLSAISINAGIVIGKSAFSASSSSVLPISKGGTGGSTPASARTGLGINATTTISSSSTDSEYPSAKAVFTFGTAGLSESGTISSDYFDIYYEKYSNKLVIMQIKSNSLKKAPLPAGATTLVTLQNSLKANPSKNINPSSNINFCSGGCASKYTYPMYIACDTSGNSSCNALIVNSAQQITSSTSALVSDTFIYTAQ
ncbi:MAG: hypothetical protein LBB07_02010 [Bifidobacteriaceae bacterium]|jgi:hypothetical protein|nr:hypothetical protein [Bifidobacteriaceae bacterium]